MHTSLESHFLWWQLHANSPWTTRQSGMPYISDIHLLSKKSLCYVCLYRCSKRCPVPSQETGIYMLKREDLEESISINFACGALLIFSSPRSLYNEVQASQKHHLPSNSSLVTFRDAGKSLLKGIVAGASIKIKILVSYIHLRFMHLTYIVIL